MKGETVSAFDALEFAGVNASARSLWQSSGNVIFRGDFMKLSLMVRSGVQNIFKVFVRFPLTCVLLFAVLILTFLDVDVMVPQFVHESFALWIGVALSLAATLAVEGRKIWIQVVSYVGVLLAMVGYYALIQGGTFALIEMTRFGVILGVLLLACLVIPVFRHRSVFNEGFISSFKGFFTTAFFVGVAYGGIMAILGAVDNLLFRLPGTTYMYVSLFVWIFCAPIVFLSLIPKFGIEEEKERNARLCSVPGFMRIMLMYVVIPLAYVYTLVLIAYIVRTLVTGDSGALLYPMALTFFAAVIMIYILSGTLENKLISFSRLLFPKLMLVIALYTSIQLFRELPKVGVTNTTYYAILFTVYSCVVGVVTIFLPMKRNEILAMILSGLLVISIVPPVDAFTVSTNMQTTIAEEVLVRNGMRDGDVIVRNVDIPEEDKAKLRTAMAYLDEIDAPQLVKGIPAYFSYYADFSMTFGFDVNPDYVTTYSGMKEFSYQMNRREPILLPDGGYLFVFGFTSGTSTDDERSIGVIEHNGQEYTLFLLTGPERYTIELRSKDTSILSVSALEARQSLVDSGVAPGSFSQIPPANMTFATENEAASLEVIFSAMEGYDATDEHAMNTDMVVLVYMKE